MKKVLHNRNWTFISLVLLVMAGYWLLPIHGQVVLVPEKSTNENVVWPLVHIEPDHLVPGQSGKVTIIDNVPWVGIYATVNGQSTKFERGEILEDGTTWRWTWSYIVPAMSSYEIVFYHDCQTGCIERARVVVGQPVDSPGPVGPAEARIPTKLGLVFANPNRDWHNRSGWIVDLTYACRADTDKYWGVDQLAERVHVATTKGLRVLVRVDYDQSQGLPPVDDYEALDLYLKYLHRLARDQRLKGIYGFIIGSDVNADDSNVLSPDKPVTPEWYARIFNGYGRDPTFADNAVEVIRAENPKVRVLVGSLRAWSTNQDGQQHYSIDEPWLNYMNSLVANISDAASADASMGVPVALPDGFAISVAGRIDAPEMVEHSPADEPRVDLFRSDWKGAQAGFRVYKDWLDVINSYPETRNLPAYIIAANTFSPDTGTPPMQNYPRGWLSNALDVINHEPQIQSLCWFIDYFPDDMQWDMFSLTNPSGRLVDAADEFDKLLRLEP
ncbi:MAG: hypothetical protein JW730_13585 [Anaerolineales bacterium]|nr:hypothetical protein [Anaerolineales bacterium]